MRPLVDFGLVVLIWLVQIVIYPSFRHVSEADFPAWHGKYTSRISYFVIPLMFAQVWVVGHQAVATRSALDVASAVLVAGAWVSTFALSLPCHQALAETGKEDEVIERLVLTNWPRTVVWTAVFVLGALRQ